MEIRITVQYPLEDFTVEESLNEVLDHFDVEELIEFAISTTSLGDVAEKYGMEYLDGSFEGVFEDNEDIMIEIQTYWNIEGQDVEDIETELNYRAGYKEEFNCVIEDESSSINDHMYSKYIDELNDYIKPRLLPSPFASLVKHFRNVYRNRATVEQTSVYYNISIKTVHNRQQVFQDIVDYLESQGYVHDEDYWLSEDTFVKNGVRASVDYINKEYNITLSIADYETVEQYIDLPSEYTNYLDKVLPYMKTQRDRYKR